MKATFTAAILAAFFSSACTVRGDDIHAAVDFCEKHKGVNRIDGDWVHCQDGLYITLEAAKKRNSND